MSDATKNKNKIKLPVNGRGAELPLVLLKDAVAQTYDSSISAETEITLNSSTGLISITVLETPVFVKAKTTAGGTAVSSSNFDMLLPVGRHEFGIEENITVLAFIEQASGGIIAVSEFSYSK